MAKQGEKDFLILDVFPEDEHTGKFGLVALSDVTFDFGRLLRVMLVHRAITSTKLCDGLSASHGVPK